MKSSIILALVTLLFSILIISEAPPALYSLQDLCSKTTYEKLCITLFNDKLRGQGDAFEINQFLVKGLEAYAEAIKASEEAGNKMLKEGKVSAAERAKIENAVFIDGNMLSTHELAKKALLDRNYDELKKHLEIEHYALAGFEGTEEEKRTPLYPTFHDPAIVISKVNLDLLTNVAMKE